MSRGVSELNVLRVHVAGPVIAPPQVALPRPAAAGQGAWSGGACLACFALVVGGVVRFQCRTGCDANAVDRITDFSLCVCPAV